MSGTDTELDAIIVGGGQAGLATSYELQRRGLRSIIIEENAELGHSWRKRWDSLVLFTPSQYSALPGLPHALPRNTYLSKDAMARYLAAYAREHQLSVRANMRATSLARDAGAWQLSARTPSGAITSFTAPSIVIATGANAVPHIPHLAAQLGPSTAQLHSSDYRNADSIADGEVLVVGAGTSGAEIALELAATHPTSLAGRATAHIPDALFALAGGAYWAFVSRVLTTATPIGRKVAAGFHDRGAPLIRVSMPQLERAGVTRLARVSAASESTVTIAGVERPAPRTIIWATGYRPDLSWLPGVPHGPSGVPITDRGVIGTIEGLYFVGMPFQFGLTSGLIGGVGRDAAYIADRVAAGVAPRR